MTRLAAALVFVALLLAGCGERPPPAKPALWEVTGPGGAHGYLFGTIHTLDEGTEWRSPAFEQAFALSDALVVEAAGIVDPDATARTWRRLEVTPGLPPLLSRVDKEHAEALRQALGRAGYDQQDFADIESWAAALTLANALSPPGGDGIDLQLLRDPRGKRVEELEGVAGQLAIFDRLPPAEQSDLLGAVAQGVIDDPKGPERLARLWSAGDIEAIAAETHKGMLADPELREALLAGRNRAWSERIDALLKSGATPLVAVGAAHLAGEDGLPALLAARGYAVRRIQ